MQLGVCKYYELQWLLQLKNDISSVARAFFSLEKFGFDDQIL
jgi:hypothetical protein